MYAVLKAKEEYKKKTTHSLRRRKTKEKQKRMKEEAEKRREKEKGGWKSIKPRRTRQHDVSERSAYTVHPSSFVVFPIHYSTTTSYTTNH